MGHIFMLTSTNIQSQVCTLLKNAGGMWEELDPEGAGMNTEDSNFKLD